MINRRRVFGFFTAMSALVLAVTMGPAAQTADNNLSKDEADCRALMQIQNLTILSADLVAANGSTPQYCHVTGLIAPAIHWHMQLPLPANWNGRLLNIGNGGKAGNLVYANDRLAE